MIERTLFEYLVNVLWQLPLLLLGAWLLIRIARPPLLVQHILWLVTLTLAILLPIRGITLSSQTAPNALQLVTASSPLQPIPEAIPINNVTDYPVASDLSPIEPPTQAPVPISSYFSIHIGSVAASPRTVHCTVILYIIVLALMLLKLVFSCITALRIRARSIRRPLTLLEANLLITCARRIHLPANRLPRIRSLVQPEQSPMVIGIRKPVLLLPESLRHSSDPTFDDQHLIAILSHELTHVRRRDYLVNLIARIASLPIAWHPAAIAMHARIRQTREMICDAQAASIFDASTTYARSLLSLAELIIHPQPHVEAVGLFDRNRKTLEERIMKLTEPQPPVTLTRRITRIATGTAILVAATTAAATLHVKPSAPAVYAAQTVSQAATPEAVATPQAATPTVGQSVPPPDAVSVQTPTPTPSPQADPKPAPDPKPKSKYIINGENREMTPEERQRFDKQMEDMRAQIQAAMAKIDTAKMAEQIKAANLKAFDSADFKKQMDDLKASLKNLKAFDGEQLSKLNSPEFKKQMDDLDIKLNSKEFKDKMKLSMPDLDHLDFKMDLQNRISMHTDDPAYQKRIADAREQLHDQLKQADHDPVQIQKAVDAFVKVIDTATQDHIRERVRTTPPATPPPPSSTSTP